MVEIGDEMNGNCELDGCDELNEDYGDDTEMHNDFGESSNDQTHTYDSTFDFEQEEWEDEFSYDLFN